MAGATQTPFSVDPNNIFEARIPGDGVAFQAGQWSTGRATHYGPFPSRPFMSEQGYLPNGVGVGCSDGPNDPRWASILANGTYPAPLDGLSTNNTLWPIVATVAVSERMYGGSNKPIVCFQPLQIRNANNHSYSITAYVVDFCPTLGCLWGRKELSFNVDVYGEHTWTVLGAGLDDGTVPLEIQWPANLAPHDTGPYGTTSDATTSIVGFFLLSYILLASLIAMVSST